jgi:hypothetical protein
MAYSHGTPNSIVKDGLTFAVDPANIRSYPRSGATVTDLIGNNTGTAAATPIFENTNAGVFKMDGGDDYINIGRPDVLNFIGQTDAFSISAWVKPTSTSPTIYSFGASASTRQIQYTIYSDTQLAIRVGGSDSISSAGGITSLTDGNWHYVTTTVPAASSGVLFYHNSNLLTNHSSVIGTATNSADANIGARTNGSYTFEGRMGPLHVYNKVLSLAEIQQNYRALKGRFE